ncbi:MAG TPA: hypothetical protein VGF35_07255 [Steroidobacteraceae bacterium]
MVARALRKSPGSLLLSTLLLCGCHGQARSLASPALTEQQRIEVIGDVRVFALEVAQDVTLRGPGAWSKHFSGAPEFFMASQGALQFANGAAATEGIEALTHTLKRIQLHFGDDLRVDPLTVDYAVVAASFTEVLTDNADHDTAVSGFFTALAERRGGGWVFRNAHWSLRAAEEPGASNSSP